MGKRRFEYYCNDIENVENYEKAKVRQSYKEYKLSGGSLKWNDFQKQYRGE